MKFKKKNKRLYRLYNYLKYNVVILNQMKIYLYIIYYLLLCK